MKRIAVVTLAVLGVLAGGTVVSQAQNVAPLNDNYLESLALNQDGTRLERTDTLKDVRDTTNASVQPDVFSPPRSGGPAEVTTCDGASYGKTIWYDFYPDVPGIARIRANGYDAVISVVQFDRRTAMPNFTSRACINDSTSTQEELLTRVRQGPRVHDPARRREQRLGPARVPVRLPRGHRRRRRARRRGPVPEA